MRGIPRRKVPRPAVFCNQVRIHGGKLNGVMGVFMQVQGKRNRRVVVLLEGVMAVAAEVHPDLIEVIS